MYDLSEHFYWAEATRTEVFGKDPQHSASHEACSSLFSEPTSELPVRDTDRLSAVSCQVSVKDLFPRSCPLAFSWFPPHPVRPRPLYLSLSPHNPPHPTLTVLNSRFDPTRPVASLRIKPTLSLSLALALALSLSLSRSLALALSLSRARALSSHIMYARPHKSHHHLMIPPPPLRVRPTGL